MRCLYPSGCREHQNKGHISLLNARARLGGEWCDAKDIRSGLWLPWNRTSARGTKWCPDLLEVRRRFYLIQGLSLVWWKSPNKSCFGPRTWISFSGIEEKFIAVWMPALIWMEIAYLDLQVCAKSVKAMGSCHTDFLLPVKILQWLPGISCIICRKWTTGY